MLATGRSNSLALESGQSLLSRRKSSAVYKSTNLHHGQLAPSMVADPATNRLLQTAKYSLRASKRLLLLITIAILFICLVFYKPRQTVTKAQQTVKTVKSYLTLPPELCKPNQEFCPGVGQPSRKTALLRNGILSPLIFPFDTERKQDDSVPTLDSSLFAYSNQTPPAYQISAWPKEIVLAPNAVPSQQLFYGIATTVERAIEYAGHNWPHFINPPNGRNPSRCLVLLPPEQNERIYELKTSLKELGVDCYVKASSIGLYERRFSTLVNETWAIDQQGQLNTKWFLFGDDDTLWLDPIATIRALSAYSTNDNWFFGALSDADQHVKFFGKQAYGGAGMIYSRALMAKINLPENWQKCGPDMEAVNTPGWSFPGETQLGQIGGDGMLTYFASIGKGVGYREALDELEGLQQIDFDGEISGLIQSGKPILTLHHYRSWARIHPELAEQPGMPYMDQWAIIDLMLRSIRVLGYDNYRRRYAFDGGRVLLVNGFCIVILKRAFKSQELALVEQTWGRQPTYPFRPSLPDSNDETKFSGDHDQAKTVYWLRDIAVDEHDKSRSFMIYETTIGRRIVIEWNENWTRVQDRLQSGVTN